MIEIQTIVVTPFVQNARILWSRKDRSCVVIDPGGDSEKILSFLSDNSLSCNQIWLTHSHLDHCGGVKQIKDSTKAVLYGHRGEAIMRSSVEEISTMYGITDKSMVNCPEPDEYISGEEKLLYGGVEFETIFTPGHSPGHICFYSPALQLVISGDLVFAGSVGRTDLPGGDSRTLMKSIKEKLLKLPDETKILPGHGPDTTIGEERRTNPFLTGEANV